MAKYNVLFSCGHKERIDITGSEKDRVNKISFFEKKGLCSKCYKKAKGYKKRGIKKYVIQYMDLCLRFENEEEATRFYENNSCDYMDAPEAIWIEDSPTSILAWQEDGTHPYLYEIDGLDWVL